MLILTLTKRHKCNHVFFYFMYILQIIILKFLCMKYKVHSYSWIDCAHFGFSTSQFINFSSIFWSWNPKISTRKLPRNIVSEFVFNPTVQPIITRRAIHTVHSLWAISARRTTASAASSATAISTIATITSVATRCIYFYYVQISVGCRGVIYNYISSFATITSDTAIPTGAAMSTITTGSLFRYLFCNFLFDFPACCIFLYYRFLDVFGVKFTCRSISSIAAPEL